MISNLKRYKSTIQILLQALRKQVTDGEWTLNGSSAISFDESLYRSVMTVYYILSNKSMIYDEDKNGDIYIGIDLNKTSMLRKNDTYTNYKDTVAHSVYMTIKYSNDTQSYWNSLLDDISPYTQKSFLGDASVRSEQIPKTNLYKKYEKALEEVYDSGKVIATLNDGEFPTLSNRSLLPLLIIRPKKGVVEYANTYYPGAYNKSRKKFDLSKVMDRNDLRMGMSDVCIPISLITVSITGKHIKRSS